MKNLYKKYEEGGTGGFKEGSTFYFGHTWWFGKTYQGRRVRVVEALQDMLGQSDMDKAMEEFNEKVDRMPTARESNMRPGREDLMNLIGKLPDPEKIRPRQARYVPGGSSYKPFVKFMDPKNDREYNDTSGGRKAIGPTNPNVGKELTLVVVYLEEDELI